MKRTILVMLGTVLVAASWQAVADTLPPYTRPVGQGTDTSGHPGGARDATYSTWGFGTPIAISGDPKVGVSFTSDTPAATTWGQHVVALPTGNWPISGAAPTALFLGNAYIHTYNSSLFGRSGVVGLSGKLEFNIPNTPLDHNREKWMQVQIDWRPIVGGGVPTLIASTAGYLSVVNTDWTRTTTPADANGWFTTTLSAAGFDGLTDGIHHNPTGEMFVLEGNVYVDNVIIDTTCVPEPGQVAMMVITGLGALGYGVRRYYGRKQS